MIQADLFTNQPVAMRPMPAERAPSLSAPSARPARNASTGQPDQRGQRDTSKDALKRMVDCGALSERQAQVLAAIRGASGDLTRAEVARATGMTHGASCGRCHELLAAGLIEETARRTCSVTGASSHGVRAT